MQYAEALKILASHARAATPEVERVALADAVNRRAGEDHLSSLTIPPFDNSGVDGYCFPASKTRLASAAQPVHFKIAGTLFPGATPPEETPAGHAWEIMTGAPFPKDCDCSVKVEDTPAERDANGRVSRISLSAPISSKENLRAAGADFSPGLRIVSKGEKIRAEHLMGLAANGFAHVVVYKKPKVVVVPTGLELVPVGETLKSGQIYNSSLPYLVAALNALGCDVQAMPILKDDPQAFATLLQSLKSSPPDLLITTGAVSMGQADFIRPGLEAAGAQIAFHRVDIRPGKPVLFSHFDASCGAKKPFVSFGLPGNPVSSVVGVRFFIEPYLRAWMGLPAETPLKARLVSAYRKPEGLRCFLKASYEVKDLVPTVTILSGQPSFMTRPLLQASAWAVVPESTGEALPGDLIELYPQTSDF